MKKVLIISQVFGQGGMERVIISLIKNNPNIRFTVLVYDFYDELSFELEELKNVNVVHLQKSSGIDFAVAKKIYHLIRDEQFDYIHLHTLGSLVYYALAYVMLLPHLLLVKHKSSITIHGPIDIRGFKRKAILVFGQFLISNIILVSKTISLHPRFYWKLFLKDKIKTIPNGINLSSQDIVLKEIEDKNEINLILISRIARIKNIEVLIPVVQKLLKETKLSVKVIIFGSHIDPYSVSLKSKINDYGLSKNFDFRGHAKNLMSELSSIKNGVFVAPSFSEGLPLSVLEAALSGFCILLSDIPAHRYLFSQYGNDLNAIKASYFSPYHPDELFNLIMKAIKSEMRLIETRDMILQNKDIFSDTHMASKYLEIYNAG